MVKSASATHTSIARVLDAIPRSTTSSSTRSLADIPRGVRVREIHRKVFVGPFAIAEETIREIERK